MTAFIIKLYKNCMPQIFLSVCFLSASILHEIKSILKKTTAELWCACYCSEKTSSSAVGKSLIKL